MRILCSSLEQRLWPVLAAFGMFWTASAATLSEEAGPLFSGAGTCALCHTATGRSMLDARGRPVGVVEDWQGTMMANAFRDPLWRATMEAEIAENPGLQEFIENKCQTCHAPMGRTAAKAAGQENYPFARAKTEALAGEGVGCTLCHQVADQQLGQAASFTGGYTLNSNRHIYGPYPDPFAMPMRRHVDYTPVHSRHVQDSGLCATCHTLFTPILDAQGKVQGQFPEQVPYLEWRNSAHAAEGRHCQDCHLPKLDEPVKISFMPPWLEGRQPYWRHQFVGGNAFMLRLLAAHADRLDANASPAQFKPLIHETRQQLGRAVTLQAQGRRDGSRAVLEVEVRNLTGHKFPTGHPYRRAWLHVQVADARGRVLFDSGRVDRNGAIHGVQGYQDHHTVIRQPDQVQIYQSVMGDLQGQPTWSLLRGAAYLKDNRLPPRGFRPAAADRDTVAVRGAAERDGDFDAAAGSDRVRYELALPEKAGAATARVRLLYQSAPPEAAARFADSRLPEARAFTRLYQRMDKTPEVVAEASVELGR